MTGLDALVGALGFCLGALSVCMTLYGKVTRACTQLEGLPGLVERLGKLELAFAEGAHVHRRRTDSVPA